MCSSYRSSERGYALMLAMVIAATVLGGSAVLLQRAAASRREAVKKEHVVLLDSALRSVHAFLERRLFWRDGAHEPEITLGDVKIALEDQPVDDPLVRSVKVTASLGKDSRQAVWSFQRGMATKIACVNCVGSPVMEIHGGAGAGDAIAVKHIRDLPVSDDLCVVKTSDTELPPAQCDGRPRIRIESPGPLVLRARTAPRPEDAALPRLFDIRAEGPIHLAQPLTFDGVMLHLQAPSLETEKNAPLTLKGGVILDVPQLSIDPSSKWLITGDDPAVERLMSPPRPGMSLVPSHFCVP